ncbi:hypothetical protein GCM10009739_25710 [Microbacterium ulmi]
MRDPDLRALLGVVEQTRRGDSRLDERRASRIGARASEQLGGEKRPRGIGVAPMRGDTGEARRPSWTDERAELDRVAREHDGQVHGVSRHQRGGAPRLDEMVREHHDRSVVGIVRPSDVEPCLAPDVEAGVGHGLRERVGRGCREPVGRLHDDAPSAPCARHLERAGDPLHEPLARPGGSAEGRRDGFERGIRDALLELADEPLLPRLGLDHDRDGIDAELERRRGAPERRMSGVESRHAPIMEPPRAVGRVVHNGGRVRTASRSPVEEPARAGCMDRRRSSEPGGGPGGIDRTRSAKSRIA